MSFINFYILDATKKVIQTGTCAESQFKYQKGEPGETVHRGEASLGDFINSNGVYQKIGAPPSEFHTYSYEKQLWVVDSVKAWEMVRRERDKRIAETDWTQLPDVPLETKELWAVYRQALRDVTEQEDPTNIQWPEKPV